MTNSAVLFHRGMECLMENLGLVEAERFISLINTEAFDYTEWRKKNLFSDIAVNDLSKEAMEYRQTKQAGLTDK